MLRAYVIDVLPQAQRISASLRRLGAQSHRLPAVADLLLDYQSLLALYRQAAVAKPGGVSAGSISAAQQRAAASARALHVPLCAPVGATRS